MKKIFYLFSIMLFLYSCGDNFLETEPLTMKTNTNFYQTPGDIESALYGAYAMIAPETQDNNSFLISELMSGERLPGGGPDDQFALAIGQFRNYEDDMYLDLWSRNYTGIFRSNMLLQSLEQVKFDSDEQAAKAEGEARFLRAYFYFELAKMFGTAPLVLKTEPENLPKATPEELYAQIAEDLKIAIEKLPSKTYDHKEIGRTNKWIAQGFMARVFLFYTGVYKKDALPLKDGSVTKQQVIGYIDDCVSNSGYKLVPEFRNLWPYAQTGKFYKYAEDNNLEWVGEEGGNTEAMFTIRFSKTGNWELSLTRSNQMPLFFGWRSQDEVPFGQGWGWGSVSPLMWNEWPNNDIRKKGSICDVNDANEGISGYTWGADNIQQETGYWQKKYMPINILVDGAPQNYSMSMYGAPEDFMLNNTQETVLLRFADILLMGAELGSAKGQQYLDQVRARVNLASVPLNLENIKKERRYELAFEGLRYFDLLRWGDAEKEINKLKNIPVKNANKDATYSTSFKPATMGFLPIPNSQIQLSNDVLVQNPGW